MFILGIIVLCIGYIAASCRTPYDHPGVCMPLPQCEVLKTQLLTYNPPLSEYIVRNFKNYECKPGKESNQVYVCCPENKDFLVHKNFNLINHRDCGMVIERGLIKGDKLEIGEYPYIALISYKTDNGNKFQCVGTLINDFYVLTTADCLVDKKLAGVRLGENYLEQDIDCDEYSNCSEKYQDVAVEEVIPHKAYNSMNLQNNIGLIRLAKIANTTHASIKPVCLPLYKPAAAPHNALYRTLGWNLLNEKYSHKLMMLKMHPVELKECQKEFNGFLEIGDKVTCASKNYDGGIDITDGGAPLLGVEIFDRLKMVQYGLFSAKHKLVNHPLVYTDVQSYTDWILDNMRP